MRHIKDGFHSIASVVHYMNLVNADPALPGSRNNRQNLRRWRVRLGENWRSYQLQLQAEKRHIGIGLQHIIDELVIEQFEWPPGRVPPYRDRVINGDPTFFYLMTELLAEAAAVNP